MKTESNTEKRYVIVYGYTRKEMQKVLKHFVKHLPDTIKLTIESYLLVTRLTLIGKNSGIELLRFNLNRYHQDLRDIFTKDVVATDDIPLAAVLGNLLRERELTVSCAESCTGGNIAHRITLQPGSSNYFLGSVVSYANDIKTRVLGVPQKYIDKFGAVSREVVEAMAEGTAKLTRSDCAISTSGIAGPDGGTKSKPVGTVWIGVKYGSKLVSECKHFEGERNDVIDSATAHGIVMLINLLRDSYEEEDDLADE